MILRNLSLPVQSLDKLHSRALFPVILLVLSTIISGCASAADTMPATRVDVFVLDISTSNDKTDQLNRIKEELDASLTANALGIPKPEANAPPEGPVTTIFTFIIDVAPKAQKFKLQDATDVRKLWVDEFAKDHERNMKSWSTVSDIYNSYARRSLGNYKNFQLSDCNNTMSNDLKPKFSSDIKRNRIVRVLCDKIMTLTQNYGQLLDYVNTTNSPGTDIYGALNQMDRLVSEVLTNELNSVISINISSDMQHETGDSRDTPARLRALSLEPVAACNLGKADRQKDTISFDSKTSLHVSGIANAKKMRADYGDALIHYWQCFFVSSADIR